MGRVCDVMEILQSRLATATSRPPARDIRDTVNPPRGFDQSAMLTSYRVWDYQTKASETVETLRVPTSPQGEHSLAESRYDHWWRLPDVYVGAKNSTGFPNTCRK